VIFSKLGLVILNYNSYQHTIRCVNSILYHYGKEITIVIVDNHSSGIDLTILTETYSSHPEIVILETGFNGGYSSGNNIGLKYLAGNYPEIEYLGVINPDVIILDNRIFQNLIERLHEDENLAGITPLMIINNTIKPERWAYKLPRHIDNFLSSLIILKWINPSVYRSFIIDKDTMVAYVDVIPGSFLIIKKDIFMRINLFDEKIFLYGEEIILGMKIKRERLKLGLSFRDHYIHYHPNSKGNIRNDLFHLKCSLKSHFYFNSNYKNIFWGTLDSILQIVFLPLRVLEIIIVFLHSEIKNRNLPGR